MTKFGVMMKIVNIREAKTQLSRLVEQAIKGEPFVIAKAGKPMVKVTMIEDVAPKRVGFLEGLYEIPEDFDDMASDKIAALFAGKEEFPE